MKTNLKGASLVTGGAGFIGSNLCKALLERGEKVVCVDNLSTGSRQNIEELSKQPSFYFIEGDVRKADLQKLQVDSVYHLAALCGVPRVECMPLDVILTGIEGTLRVLGWAAERKIPVLFVSSSEIYGNADVHPQSENYWGYTNPLGPRSPYVEAKRGGEALCRAYEMERGLKVRIARLFNVYGPGYCLDDQRVIPTFIRAAEACEDIIIYGHGEQTRSFCYVDDIVEGLITLMSCDVHCPTNLGFPEETEIKELACMVVSLTGSRSRTVFLPALHEDPPRRLPDITRARQLLGWEPRVTLKAGLAKTIGWYRKMRKVSLSVESRKEHPVGDKSRRY